MKRLRNGKRRVGFSILTPVLNSILGWKSIITCCLKGAIIMLVISEPKAAGLDDNSALGVNAFYEELLDAF